MPIGMDVLQKKTIKIQKIHCKSLKVVYNKNKNYDELLRDKTITCINMGSFQIFKQSKSWVYVVVLCFQKHNVQYKKRSFGEITCCNIDFLRHKFSVIQNMSVLEQFAPICSMQWIYAWMKNENERSRKYWLFLYFMSMKR